MDEKVLQIIYEMAKDIYNGEKDIDICKTIVHKQYNINQRSFAGWFVPAFKYMLEGKTLRGEIPQKMKRLYLQNIYKDYGKKGLENALKSYQGSIRYYENIGCNKPGDNYIYQEFKQILDNALKEEEYFNHKETEDLFEGICKRIETNHFERNPKARAECIKIKGTTCIICGFNFEKIYGVQGKDFIHVHHIIPLSSIGESYKLNVKKDLVPVCPNCHAMLHKKKNGELISIQELKSIIENNKNN